MGDELSWALIDGPAGMAISPFGVLSWTPEDSDIGSTPRVQIAVGDTQGNTDLQTFMLSVSAPVLVPDLAGLDESDASEALQTAGLALARVRESYDPAIPAGAVISQNITAGTEAAAGSLVDIVLSLGPQPVFVPNLAGITEGAAIALLEGLDLVPGLVTHVNDDNLPRGVVQAQGTAPGMRVEPSTPIDLVVSGGPAARLTMERLLLGPGDNLPFSLTFFDPGGEPVAQPGDTSVTLLPVSASGDLPTVGTGSISTQQSTRGLYRLQVSSAVHGVDLQRQFAVSRDSSDDGAQAAYARLSSTVTALRAVYAALADALVSNPTEVPALAAELADLRTSIDTDALLLTPPLTLENGFCHPAWRWVPPTSSTTCNGRRTCPQASPK